ncbi:cupin domain-containing protein [Bacillus sp. OV166]|uniref:cupin domain-containing protein n=1 Tax=Bacillus sp. OV166 TaxID=1882763 RepID=UPI00267D4008|nr:cupin domain-containing protein [Bacillus sp. OV166]
MDYNITSIKKVIIDVPITDQKNAVQLEYFSMQPCESFTFTYTFLEMKVVLNGKIVIRDDQDQKYVAEKGDVLIFTPDTTAIFDGERDGDAIYTAHRLP